MEAKIMIYNHIFLANAPNEVTVYTVHSQRELDMLDVNTPMLICIEDPIEPIVIRKRYPKPVRIMEGYAFVEGDAVLEAYNDAHIVCKDSATVIAYDHVKVDAMNKCVIEAYNRSVVNAFSQSDVSAYQDTLIFLYDQTKCNAYGSSNVVARGENTINLMEDAIIKPDNTNIINVQQNAQDYSAIVVTSRYEPPCEIPTEYSNESEPVHSTNVAENNMNSEYNDYTNPPEKQKNLLTHDEQNDDSSCLPFDNSINFANSRVDTSYPTFEI